MPKPVNTPRDTPPPGSVPDGASSDSPTRVVELAVNLDDVSGELIGAAFGELLAAGALDVWTVGITMKKQRPGVMLCVLVAEDEADRLCRVLLEATGSFGVRRRAWDRVVLDRHHIQVETLLGPVRVKVGQIDGRVLVARPEHDDVARLAVEAKVLVREAMATAEAAAQQWVEAQRSNNAPHAGGAS